MVWKSNCISSSFANEAANISQEITRIIWQSQSINFLKKQTQVLEASNSYFSQRLHVVESFEINNQTWENLRDLFEFSGIQGNTYVNSLAC